MGKEGKGEKRPGSILSRGLSTPSPGSVTLLDGARGQSRGKRRKKEDGEQEIVCFTPPQPAAAQKGAGYLEATETRGSNPAGSIP